MEIFLILLCLMMVFVNGWTDAPNAISSAVGIRAIGVKSAVVTAAIFNILGVVFTTAFGGRVLRTVMDLSGFEKVSQNLTLVGLCSAMLGVIIWSSLAALLGLPTSESHALLAGLSGAALAVGGSINLKGWLGVMMGLVSSLLFPFAVSLGVATALGFLLRNQRRRRWDKFFRGGAALLSALSAFMHGAQDGQKFMGVLLLGFGDSGEGYPLFSALSVGAVMGLGTAVGGYKIIKTLGLSMVKLEPFSALSGELGSALTLGVLTALGIPVSTTHVKATALMGAGAVRGIKAMNFSVIKDMLLAWLLTFPVCGLLSFVLTRIIISDFWH